MTPTIENVSLVKEQSRPEIYFVCSNTKFLIPPAEFNAMGFRGDKGQIVPDGTLTSPTPGTLDPFPSKPFVNPRSPVKPTNVHFTPPGPQDVEGIGKWYGNCKPAASIIKPDIMIAGWLESDPYPNDNPQGMEDIIYEGVLLDPDFIDRMYGNDGLSNALAGWRLPGNPRLATQDQLPVADLDMDGNSRGVTLNSFTLPSRLSLHCEQNAWHVKSTEVLGRVNWIGRGDPPQGWIKRPFKEHDDTWWPYDPVNPENSPSGNLRTGDYVLMKGTLWEDSSHGPRNWTRTHYGHDGWLELHPIDWMVRLESPPPHRRKTTAQLLVAPDERPIEIPPDLGPPVIPPSPSPNDYKGSVSITPDFDVPGKQLKVHTCRELVDGRFTFPDTVVHDDVRTVDGQGQPLDRVDVNIEVQSGPGDLSPWERPGRFKAVYIVTWQGQQTSNAAFVSQSVPSAMRATQQSGVSVTMKNTGSTTWRPGGANPFRLGSQNPQDNSVWGTGRVDVPAEAAPGDEATFRFAVVAPPSIGVYNFQWRMMQEAVEWFGDFTPNLRVQVTTKGTLNVWMEPNSPTWGFPATYTVRATDTETGVDVLGGKVTITNPGATPQVFDVNTPFTFTFRIQRRLVDPRPPREWEIIYPEGTVTAPGYAPFDLVFWET